MSSFVINPNSDTYIFKIRTEDITHAVNIYYDYINDYYEKVDNSEKKCLVYDVNSHKVILVFPLIQPVNMDLFREKVKYIKNFYLLDDDISEEVDLLPTETIPHVPLTDPISEYLSMDTEEDLAIQDVTIGMAMSIRGLSMIKRYGEDRIMREIFDIWDESGVCNNEEHMTRLELGSYLSKMSKEQYDNIKCDKVLKRVEMLYNFEKINQNCENIITDAMYEVLVDNIVYCGGIWWHFQDGFWKEDDGQYVWSIISKYFTRFLESIVSIDRSIISLVIIYMGSFSARHRILKDLSMKLGDYKFSSKLNSKTNLIGMKNGTYVLDENILRESLPSDYLSLSCGINYLTNKKDGDMISLVSILRQIFPKEEVLRFFIRSCSSMLEGYNKYKVFYIWWGSGNNAKTLMQRFVSACLGEYSVSLSTSLITGKRGRSSEATPDIHLAKNKLVVFLQEPNPEEKIQVGRIKEFTGNDKMYVRDLFKSGENADFKAKIVIVANNSLETPGADVAFRRRVVVIPFESTFVDNLKKNRNTYQFKIDEDMETKIFKYKELFLNILLNEYSIFRKRGLEIPEYVRKKTAEYLTLNNYPLKFIREHLYKEAKSDLSSSEIYEYFKTWFKRSYPGRSIDIQSSLLAELNNEDYEIVDNIVKNVTIVE